MSNSDQNSQGWLFPDLADSQWYQVCGYSDLTEGRGRAIEIDGRMIAFFLLEGSVYAIDSRCTHAGAPLAFGWLVGDDVICPLHRWKFNVKTGQCRTDKTRPIGTYPTKIDDLDQVWVKLTNQTGQSEI